MSIRYVPAAVVLGGVFFANGAYAANAIAGPEKHPFQQPDMAGYAPSFTTTSGSAALVTDLPQGVFGSGDPVYDFKLPVPDFNKGGEVVDPVDQPKLFMLRGKNFWSADLSPRGNPAPPAAPPREN